MKPVTIRDIARLLNLSITTVSRALDGYPDVSNRTRLRVLETADELGYVPNQAARQLRRHKTDVIGFVLPSAQPKFSDPFYSEFLTGLGDEAATHGMDLLISIAPPDTEDEKNIFKRWARSQKVDGIILNHIRAQDWRIRFLRDEALPFVSLEHNQDNAELPYIEVTNQASMKEIVTHLAKNGYKNIAYIGGFENYVVQQSRMQGFLDGLNTHGLAIHNNFIHLGDFTSASGYSITHKILEQNPHPDAIVCINDETAFGVLHALHKKNLIPGKEIAVTGFGGVLESRYSEPPLTTVDVPIYETARQLVQLLLGVIRKEEMAVSQVQISAPLIIRETTRKG